MRYETTVVTVSATGTETNLWKLITLPILHYNFVNSSYDVNWLINYVIKFWLIQESFH